MKRNPAEDEISSPALNIMSADMSTVDVRHCSTAALQGRSLPRS